MAKLNPIEEADYIENEFRKYLKSTFNFNEEEYKKRLYEELDDSKLFKGPFIKATLPFKKGDSIRTLIEKKIVSSEFSKLGKINLDQKLYLHQQESLNKIANGRNVVITTGTGSGKTECFLYPIIDSLLKEKEKSTLNDGIRAIFLYPMNALVNDQIDRVRQILKAYPDITYGFFTGDTPPNVDVEKYRCELEELNGVTIPKNELITREQIREHVPHLLFTNYSMLEYLLIRPNDYVLFKNDMLNNWRYVVLDEAHTYNGALGIEVSMLLRRLTGMANSKPQFILTSATLGEKGKSENDIIQFAKNLTSSNYDIEDIIFSSRVKLDEKNIEYTINPKDYIDLDNAKDDINLLKKVGSKYKDISENDDYNKYLYELLIRDSNIYTLFNELNSNDITFKNVYIKMKKYNFNEQKELISLIHLINLAKNNYDFLYDMKYHSFIRTLSGAYATLGKNKKLSLSPTYFIDGKRTFELGNCRYCNATYIMGKISKDNILHQNADIDIYENYGDNERVNIDYFLLKEAINENEIDLTHCVEYELCTKCGKIHEKSQVNFENCDCGKDYIIDVLKVENESQNKNNIIECPCCKHRSNSGVVRSLNLGKDEATALIGQILYKAIDEKNEQDEVKNDNNISFLSFSNYKNNNSKKNKKDSVKQYLAFSDSRQQASFFADFFEYNFKRFLRNRLLWKVLEENDYNAIPFNSVITNLKNIIEEKKLFNDDNLDFEKEAWITALQELLKIAGQYSGEGLGLFYFKLNLNDLKKRLSSKVIEDEFGKYNLNEDNFYDFISVIFDVFRTTPAIDFDKSNLNGEEKITYLSYRGFENFVKLLKSKKSEEKNIHSFLPVDRRDNVVVNYTKKVCKCSTDEAIDILQKIFIVIGKECVLKKTNKFDDDVYQIESSKYELNSYKNSKIYRCNKCGKLTAYNVNHVCSKKDCDGFLEECNPDKVLENNYYRNEYKTKKIEAMVIKEHTAQLTRKIAKEYQQNFKNGQINILSCSTTFEMGVDIGDLETVFMRNVPPSPANYVQRAGRAGRRKDSSAFILTFCNNSSHDYTYFDNPLKMIDGIIDPPHFSVTNEKIIIRHLIAASLGFFFRKYSEYFKNIGNLVCDDGLKKYEEYILNKPSDLNNYINNKLLDKEIYEKYRDFKWYDLMKVKNNLISNYIDTINLEIDEFKKAIEESGKNEKFDLATYYQNQIERIKSRGVIQDLSKHSVIPKYGFPVDVVELQIYNNGIKNTNFDLNRDLSIAISEYAPESEIIVDKKKYTSRFISLPKRGELTRYYYYKCQFCERENIVNTYTNLAECKYCGQVNEIENMNYFIEPIYGFKTGENIFTGRKKPKKTYAGETIYLGNSKSLLNYSYDFNKNMKIETSTDDELLVLNTNPFYMCKKCGYTEINKKYNTREIKCKHLNYRERECFNDELTKVALGHKFKTDVAKLIIKDFNNRNIALSTLYALLEGISIAFNIERKDIDGLIVKDANTNYNIILYDNVPGGAGHVKRLKNKEILMKAFDAAFEKVNQNCCDEETSCYNCLRNFYNQKQHKFLSRKDAKTGIKYILSE